MSMPDCCVIRGARVSDLDLLCRFNGAMALETETLTLDPEQLRAGVERALADPARARYFIATRTGESAGCLMLTPEWSDWRCGWWWWIQSVYVAPAHRRRGVYRALHVHALEQARRDGAVVGLRLYVDSDNAAAQETYRAMGMSDSRYRLFEQAARSSD